MEHAVTVTEHRVVRPAQLVVGDLDDGIRVGIAALRGDSALLQVHVGDAPIRRLALEPGQVVEADGWQVELRSIDTTGRGAVVIGLEAPGRAGSSA